MSQGLKTPFLQDPTVFEVANSDVLKMNVGLRQFPRNFPKIYVKDLEYFAGVISWSWGYKGGARQCPRV